VDELLDNEEALAIQRIASTVQRFGDDLCVAADVRQRIRRHPFLATGLGAFAGFVGGPPILRTVVRLLTATSNKSKSTSPVPGNFPELVMASLRIARARR
jgi:hypothetical protein